MLKQVKEYLYSDDDTSMNDYTNGEAIKTAAFIFLIICYIASWFFIRLFLLATAPVWIIPYVIYTDRKERQ